MKAPLTPNLENLKLHGQKLKKKTTIYGEFTKKSTIPNTPISVYNQKNKQKINHPQSCLFHPQKIAKYCSNQKNSDLKYCLECALVRQQKGINYCEISPENQEDTESTKMVNIAEYKTQKISGFLALISQLKQKLTTIEQNTTDHLHFQENKIDEYFNYINESFNALIEQLQAKKEELSHRLIEMMQKRKQSTATAINTLSTINNNLQRYKFDINQHYDEIIQELQIDTFDQIISQYNAKIQYYEQSIRDDKHLSIKYPHFQQIHIYLPLQEIKKAINKCKVNCYQKQNILHRTNYNSQKSESPLNRIGHSKTLSNHPKYQRNVVEHTKSQFYF